MTNPTITEDSLKYPERVHVTTDYLVEGSDKGNWNNIWYVSSVYKRHMSPMKHLFTKDVTRLMVEGIISILHSSYQRLIHKTPIHYMHRTEFSLLSRSHFLITTNLKKRKKNFIISYGVDQLEEQGYMVSYGDNNCRIKYMFDNMEEAVEQETTIEEEDEEVSLKATTISWMAILDLWI
ncbi:hypothetical protein Tco_0614734 [Tanacetum coccineum]